MKKIMFNEPFELQKVVLDKRKTMTRRVIPQRLLDEADLMRMRELILEKDYLMSVSPYKVGEVVAIAQSYEEIYYSIPEQSRDKNIDKVSSKAGWHNKMFVKAELMPHHIRITDVKVEYLQEISDDDCINEGISYRDDIITQNLYGRAVYAYRCNGKEKQFFTPREAFASLIDKISGKGTWKSNPFVYAYEFELID